MLLWPCGPVWNRASREAFLNSAKKFQIGPCWHFFEKTYVFLVFLTIFALKGVNWILKKRLEAEKVKKVEFGLIQGRFGKNQTFGGMDHGAEFFFNFFGKSQWKIIFVVQNFNGGQKSAFLAVLWPIGRLGCYCIYFFRPSKTNAQKIKVIHFYKKITCYFMVKSKKSHFGRFRADWLFGLANRP